MLETIGINAASLRYLEEDAGPLKEELSAWCYSENYLTDATVSRQAEWLAGRVLVLRLLHRVNRVADLRMDPSFGFPELVGPASTGLFTSWSHAGDFAVAVLGPSPVGVDAERLDRSVERVVDRIATPAERARFASTEIAVEGGRLSTELALWCAKEAAAKACGLGMRWGLKNFELGPPEGPLWPVTIHQPGPRRLADPAVRFSVREGFAVALCSERALLMGPLTWS